MSFSAQTGKNCDIRPRRSRGLSEDEILDRLDELQSAIELPTEVWDFLLALATSAERIAYWSARLRPYGYVPGVARPRTDAERLAELELRVVMACGAAGVAVVEAERSKP